ncbi:ribonuclease H [Senna tora]|uniref:Ribonuclease H n=1 Tax=Senna tora TaxID=362788 RepID=A0A834W2R5_9FABA|nr:ribonuclease H [Senna tora]
MAAGILFPVINYVPDNTVAESDADFNHLSDSNGVSPKPGRLTLIKSVLTSMSLYHLSYYKLTKAEAMKCDSLLAHFFWVGTGHNIPLNHANWPTPTNNIDNPVNRVSDLVETNHRWNRTLVHQLYDAPTAREILKIPISLTQGEDKLYWSGNKEGNYKVKDGYNKLTESRNISPN